MSQAPEPPPLQPEPPDLPQSSLPQQRAPAETVSPEPRPATEPPAGPDPRSASAEQPPSAGERPLPAAAGSPTASEPPLPAPTDSPPSPPTSPLAPRKRRWWLAVGIAAGLAGILAVAGTVGYLVLNLLSEDVPTVGDCLTDAPAPDDMTVVDCASAEAYWTVIGNDGVWTHGEFEGAPAGEVCQGHPRTQQALWVSNVSGLSPQTEGEVVCLAVLDAEPSASAEPD